jgi:hypothetical protein
MKPETSVIFKTATLTLHWESVERSLVLWQISIHFTSTVSCLSLLTRSTMHDAQHFTYDTNRNVSESV